jgi:hypothetical protein
MPRAKMVKRLMRRQANMVMNEWPGLIKTV